MPTFPPHGLIAEFSDKVVAHDLPELPPERRAEVVAFIGRRVAGLPSPMRIGVGVVSVVVGGAGRLVGTSRLVRGVTGRPLPGVGDYVRLVRSLSYAYVWDAWPDTAATGRPLGRQS
ncbi:MAG: hypothetical protein ABW328_02860 [Ilumatobacteraceae bacterium]